ncbi:AraC family transcriptional regulator [Scatolibacter rhodanostii]|uniref:AraC family transcriptional regulator n=1 Tax=Scatolibacter rhodanostii TaxID=2014781 RepID=UPI000C085575|nr:AraC family transcriptional regulator [Scatolibacter rhodanostii]
MYINQNLPSLTKEEIAHAIRIWNSSAISLLDIRHNLISLQEPLCHYRLPASTFLFTSGGEAEILLNDASFHVERFGLFHGIKGTLLSIRPECEWFEYYMVLYKAGEPPFHRREFHKQLAYSNPFQQQYGFTPSNPLFFAHQLHRMYDKWKGFSPLNLFYEKAAFYQLVYEIYEELEQGCVRVFEPNVIAMATRYLDEHYGESISIQEMCGVLGISYSHFHRRFKEKTGKSPQEYLIAVRLSSSKKALLESNASIREIADSCGFSDEYNFHRLFLKNIGMTPGEYRENSSIQMRDYIIGNEVPFPYNEKGQVSFDELNKKGASSMFKQTRNKAVMAAALSLVMLMSACGTTTEKPSTAESAPTSSVSSQVEPADTEAKETKTIHMDYGDVEIPADPQRVIVIFVQGDVMALGVTPVGTSFNDGAAFGDKAQDVTVIDAFSINEEEILALDPDLILWNTTDEQVYQSLSKIAPTLATDYYNMPYDERLRFFGEVFNRSEEAETLINDFDKKLENAKTQLKEAGALDKTIICVDIREDFIRAFRGGRGGELVYDKIGFAIPEKLQTNEDFQGDSSMIDLSYEVIPEYAGDYILLNTDTDNLVDNAVWNELPAVKEGRLIQASTDMFWFNDVISMSKQIDVITEAMLDSQQ